MSILLIYINSVFSPLPDGLPQGQAPPRPTGPDIQQLLDGHQVQCCWNPGKRGVVNNASLPHHAITITICDKPRGRKGVLSVGTVDGAKTRLEGACTTSHQSLRTGGHGLKWFENIGLYDLVNEWGNWSTPRYPDID